MYTGDTSTVKEYEQGLSGNTASSHLSFERNGEACRVIASCLPQVGRGSCSFAQNIDFDCVYAAVAAAVAASLLVHDDMQAHVKSELLTKNAHLKLRVPGGATAYLAR